MTVNVCAPSFDPCDSYGRIAIELADGLEKLTAAGVNRLALNGMQETAIKPLRVALGGLFLGYPTLVDRFSGMTRYGPRVIVTMFESDRIPDDWIAPLNAAQAVIVPSRWLVEVFQQCGVTTPIHVVPLGISEAFTQPRRRQRSEPFTFLAIADRGRRKGWQKVGAAFNKAFGNDTAYKLIFKSRRFPVGITNPNVEVIEADYTDDQMRDLYTRAHVMPFPAAGEGFGFPPREFAATGGLALATDWGGTADDLHHWGIPLPYSLTTAWAGQDDWFGTLGQWAEVDVETLADLLRHVAEHYDAYTDFALRAAGYVNAHYRWSQFVREVYAIWQQTEKEYYRERNHHRENPVPAQAGR